MPSDGIHTQGESVWHYCGRCGSKADLNSELQWQNSLLLCNNCYDQSPILVGSIEQKQATQLEMIVQNPDLKPHEKLVNPITISSSDDILI